MKEYAVGEVFELDGKKYIVRCDGNANVKCIKCKAPRGLACQLLRCGNMGRSDGKSVYYEEYHESTPEKRIVGEVWRDEHGKLVQHVQTIDGTEVDWFPPDEPREGMIFRNTRAFFKINKSTGKNTTMFSSCPFGFPDFLRNGLTSVYCGDVPKEKWVPKKGETYFYFFGDGDLCETQNDEKLGDRERIEFGNCFRTRELCESAVEKVKQLLSEVPHE